MTGAQALRTAVARLRDAGIDDAPRDARVLLAHALGLGPDRLTLHLADDLPPDLPARLDRLLAARIVRQPVSQIIGHRLFWGRSFLVTPDVLDPRPETETLVAEAVSEPFQRVLDLGTGSGCILLTLLLDCPDATGTGVDLSAAALAIAEQNTQRHGLGARTTLICGDWFTGISGVFDLIVANPPYIAAHEMATLAPEVRNWEPHLALTPGGDGLDAYRQICAGVTGYLAPGGWLMVEIGPTQGAAVSSMMQAAGLGQITLCPDMDGRDRVVRGRALGPIENRVKKSLAPPQGL